MKMMRDLASVICECDARKGVQFDIEETRAMSLLLEFLSL